MSFRRRGRPSVCRGATLRSTRSSQLWRGSTKPGATAWPRTPGRASRTKRADRRSAPDFSACLELFLLFFFSGGSIPKMGDAQHGCGFPSGLPPLPFDQPQRKASFRKTRNHAQLAVWSSIWFPSTVEGGRPKRMDVLTFWVSPFWSFCHGPKGDHLNGEIAGLNRPWVQLKSTLGEAKSGRVMITYTRKNDLGRSKRRWASLRPTGSLSIEGVLPGSCWVSFRTFIMQACCTMFHQTMLKDNLRVQVHVGHASSHGNKFGGSGDARGTW